MRGDGAQLRECGEGFSEVTLKAGQSLAGQDSSFGESVVPSEQMLPSLCCLKPSLIPDMRSVCSADSGKPFILDACFCEKKYLPDYF